MELQFYIPGKPTGKARPCFTRSGGVYTPKDTVDYEERVQACFKGVYGNQKSVSGCLAVSIEVNCKIPKSWPKWKKLKAASGCLKPTVKPDLDNVAKNYSGCAEQGGLYG